MKHASSVILSPLDANGMWLATLRTLLLLPAIQGFPVDGEAVGAFLAARFGGSAAPGAPSLLAPVLS